MNEAVHDIPQERFRQNDWPTVKLGDVAEIKLGKMLDATDTEGVELPYLRNINVQWGRIDTEDLKRMYFDEDEVDTYALEPGDILVCEGGEPGSAAICGESERGMLYQKALHRVRPSSQLEPKWLLYNLQLDATSGALADLFTGTTIKHLTLTRFQEYEFPLPPLKTQRRIAAKLDTLTTHARRANDHLTAIPPLIDQFRQSVLARAFTGELTADWRKAHPDVEPASELLERIKVERRQKWIENYARKLADRARKRNEKKGKPFTDDDWQAYFDKKLEAGAKKYEEPEPVDAQKEGLLEIPETWEWVRLEQLMINGPRNGYSPKTGDDAEGVLVLRLSATTPGRLILNEETVKRAYDELPAESPFFLREGDIIVQRGNTLEYLGATAVYAGPPSTYVFPDLMIRFRVPGDPLTQYVGSYLNSPMARAYIREHATGTAGSMPKINQDVLSSVPIPLPPRDETVDVTERLRISLDAERRFSDSVSAVDRQLDRLGSSVLHAALRNTRERGD